MDLPSRTELEMIRYFKGDAKRISHFVKVHDFARLIALSEKYSQRDMLICEVSAYVHDIGIKDGERLYGRNDGQIQEQLGPAEAEKLLKKLTDDSELIDRVCEIVSIHHHAVNYHSAAHQAIVEADFLVNAYEDGLKREAIKTAGEKIFKTHTGKMLLKTIFSV